MNSLSGRHSWRNDDLELLSKALGCPAVPGEGTVEGDDTAISILKTLLLMFPENLFAVHLPQSNADDFRISTEELIMLLEGPLLSDDLHKTFNHQTASYNLTVFKITVQLISDNLLSFEEARMGRISFEAYEHHDKAGVEDRYAMRALQMTRKITAPSKLKYTLAHINRLVADRIMLYEFIEIIASAENIQDVVTEIEEIAARKAKKKDKQLYQLCDFETDLTTKEDQCLVYLEKLYQESLNTVPIKASESTDNKVQLHHLLNPCPMVLTGKRKQMKIENKNHAVILDKQLFTSNRQVCECRGNGGCTCTNNFKPTTNDADAKGKCLVAKQNENEAKGPGHNKDIKWVVTKEDMKATEVTICKLRWKMATKEFQQMIAHSSTFEDP